ncbi:hypothetical protein PC123_g9375 [Phytophthora cactorum]|nr:hypothetical protein PC123_g9375 [Phytophthora cactorum]
MGETTQDTRDGDLVAGLVECDVNGMRRAREARVETALGAALLVARTTYGQERHSLQPITLEMVLFLRQNGE